MNFSSEHPGIPQESHDTVPVIYMNKVYRGGSLMETMTISLLEHTHHSEVGSDRQKKQWQWKTPPSDAGHMISCRDRSVVLI